MGLQAQERRKVDGMRVRAPPYGLRADVRVPLLVHPASLSGQVVSSAPPCRRRNPLRETEGLPHEDDVGSFDADTVISVLSVLAV